MKRNHTTLRSMAENRNDDYVPGTPEERIGLVWPLTFEIASMSQNTMLNEDYKDMLRALSDEKVKFVLIGALEMLKP